MSRSDHRKGILKWDASHALDCWRARSQADLACCPLYRFRAPSPEVPSMARDLHMSVTAMAPANRGSFSGRVSQLSLLMRAGISRQPSATSLHQLHACRGTRGVQGYTVGMRPLKRETGPELRFRRSDPVFPGGAEGIRTPDLLIAKACQRDDIVAPER